MKKLLSFLLISIFAAANVNAQSAIPALDKSPMDLSSWPSNYAGMLAQGKKVDPLAARIIYSRPQKNGRAIFGGLVEYNQVWRLGANENTELEFFSDVKINNVKVKKGRYTVFAIPTADKWTIVINKHLNAWGAYTYDMKDDLLRVDVPVQKTTDAAEVFYIYFEKADGGFAMVAGWDNVKVSLPISM